RTAPLWRSGGSQPLAAAHPLARVRHPAPRCADARDVFPAEAALRAADCCRLGAGGLALGMKQLLCRDRRGRGAGVIELALVLPMLLLMFAAIVDFALLFQRYAVISNAAREGARIAVLPGYTQTDVQNRVTQYVQQSTGDSMLSPTTTLTT